MDMWDSLVRMIHEVGMGTIIGIICLIVVIVLVGVTIKGEGDTPYDSEK